MKAAATLLVAAFLLGGQALANDDLCTINLQKLEDQSLGMPLGTPLEQQIDALRDAAIQAQFSNDPERCIAQSAKALQMLENSNKNDGAGSD